MNNVKVKPLVWVEQDGHGESSCDYPWLLASPLIGDYAVGRHSAGDFWAYADFDDRSIGSGFETIEDAEAAAQADYEARIRSCLEP